MIRDYDKKMEVALDFYNQSQEILGMVRDNIASFNRMYGYDLLSDERTGESSDIFLSDEELKRKANIRKKVLLTDLGKVGEFSLKYILLLKQMKDYPNQSFEEFNSKPLYGIAERGVGNTYINQYHLSSEVVEQVKESKERHSLQPLHDFDYLYEMLGILDPGLLNDIYKNLELCVKSDTAANSNLASWIRTMTVCFPQYIFEDFLDINREVIQAYKAEFDRIMRESGDAFTRLRYLTNNPGNKQYNLKDMMSLLTYLSNYTRVVHEANFDDITLDINAGFSKLKILDIKKEIIIDSAPEDGKEEFCREQYAFEKAFLDELYSIERVRNNRNLQETIGLRTSLSVEDIKLLLESSYSDSELYAIITNNLSVDRLRYFTDKGITKVNDIIRIIYRLPTEDAIVSREDDLALLISLDLKTLDYIKQYPSIYNYVKEKPDVLGAFFSEIFPSGSDYDMFKKISTMRCVQENPSLLALLEYGQLKLYKLGGGGLLDADTVVSNISNNIEMFKDDPIFTKLPIMLDANNNKKIYELLTINGFDEKSIDDNFDSTVFCFPIDFVLKVTSEMEKDDLSLIEDGNVSDKFSDYAKRIIDDNKEPLKFNLQQILSGKYSRVNESGNGKK